MTRDPCNDLSAGNGYSPSDDTVGDDGYGYSSKPHTYGSARHHRFDYQPNHLHHVSDYSVSRDSRFYDQMRPASKPGNYSTAMAIFAPLEILAAHSHLEDGFYSESYPSAEHIVWKAVSAAVRKDPSIPAAIIRLYFHDCFVRVRYNSLVSIYLPFKYNCDVSVLLKTTSSKNPSKQDSVANKGLRGLDVIDKVKAKVEAECPGTGANLNALS
ncbi:hypothetical protein POM88_020535 [Heracleum sosnowskyi]|uniref:peroxidase n=1 Tax=Heracleum sosnowskyi TaxID=360622 RepID=A0AAD8MN77_9APIA|nr:hypothetical protein POM88_020535 [Heracleum sosnowskyi]